MRRVGPYGPANVEVMERMKEWAKDRNLLESATLFAIARDNLERTPPENCRFDACIVISKDDQMNDDVVNEGELPGGKYAIYKVRHTVEDIQKAYDGIFPSLEGGGYQVDNNKLIMEKYIGDMDNEPYCETCVPIKML